MLDEMKYRFDKFNSPFRNSSDKNNNGDYDLRGYWKEYGTLNPTAANGHLTDTYKQPNHITFSNESKYNNSANAGGVWQQLPNGSYTFTPSSFNLQMHSPEEYASYFETYEPGNQVILPRGDI